LIHNVHDEASTARRIKIIIIITVFIQRLTDRRLVYNGITHV